MKSINPTRMSAITLKNSIAPKQKVSVPENVTQRPPNVLDKSLLALALLGLTTMSSCSKDEYLGEILDEPPRSEVVSSTRQSEDNFEERKNTYDRTNSICKLLGILNEEKDSLQKIETVSCKDNEGLRHYIKPTTIYENRITGKGMTILPDDSAGEIYNFMIKNADNNSIDFIKTHTDGKTEIKNYEISEDSTLVEYDVLEGGYKLENSVYKKLDDGSIEQTFTDGSTKIYSNISLEYPYPTPITFGAEVDDYSNTDVNV